MEFEQYNGIWIRTGEYGQQDRSVVDEVVLEDSYQVKDIPSFGSGEVVIDVGSHIGCFAKVWHDKNPEARILCVEACQENIPLLERNVGEFATIIHAACIYDPRDIMLLNSIQPGGRATGGSMVRPAGFHIGPEYEEMYWPDNRPLPKVSIEDLMVAIKTDHIDVLKLDCEGDEFSIFDNSMSLDRCRLILGEYHDANRWKKVVDEKFCDWKYDHIFTSGELGIFRLQRI